MSDIPDRSDTENSAIEMGDNVGHGTENASGDLVGQHHESLTEGDWRSLDEFVALRAESEPMEPHPNQRSDSENEEYYKDVDTALRERFSGGEWRGDEMDRISREPTRPLEQTNEPSEDTHRFDALTGETNHLGANDQTAPMESSRPARQLDDTQPAPAARPENTDRMPGVKESDVPFNAQETFADTVPGVRPDLADRPTDRLDTPTQPDLRQQFRDEGENR